MPGHGAASLHYKGDTGTHAFRISSAKENAGKRGDWYQIYRRGKMI